MRANWFKSTLRKCAVTPCTASSTVNSVYLLTKPLNNLNAFVYLYCGLVRVCGFWEKDDKLYIKFFWDISRFRLAILKRGRCSYRSKKYPTSSGTLIESVCTAMYLRLVKCCSNARTIPFSVTVLTFVEEPCLM